MSDNFTPAQRGAAKTAAAIEREKELAAEEAAEYAYCESRVQSRQTFNDWTVQELTDLEASGAPAPISGDPVVTLQEAIDRGAVTVTKGLPGAVVWRRNNPELAKTHAYFEFKSARLGMWPAPSHEALTDSITALAGVQRRLMIGGVLGVAQ